MKGHVGLKFLVASVFAALFGLAGAASNKRPVFPEPKYFRKLNILNCYLS